MRNILVSTLMLSSVLFPVAANAASKSADDANVSTTDLRASAGVTAPTLVDAISVTLPAGKTTSFLSPISNVALTFTVDADGHAENVKVLKSTNDFRNSRVIEAVENAKFQPGKLGDQAVPMDMKLAVTVLP